MNVARVSTNGQITIPTEIRKQLDLKEGDKVAFVAQGGNILLLNSNRLAWEELQKAFEGAAEKAGFKNEQDVVDYCKEIRREMWEKRHGHND